MGLLRFDRLLTQGRLSRCQLSRRWLIPLHLAIAVCAPVSDATAAPISKPWTVLIYMNGKNDLEEYALNNFEQLASVDPGSNVEFVVQLGRPNARRPDQLPQKARYGGWSGVRRFHVVRGTTPAPGQELEVVGDAANVDMGSKQTLSAFLIWGRAHFPAQHYVVIVWNHGQGYRLMMAGQAINDASRQAGSPEGSSIPIAKATPGVGFSHRAISQDADSGSIIYNADLRSALIDAKFGDSLSVIGFDACLMAMVETAYQLRGLAPLMVASEELEPGPGWDYTRVANLWAGRANPSGADIAKGIVTSYKEEYGDSDETTLSAIKLSAVNALSSELSSLSDILISERNSLFPLVKTARSTRGTYNDAYTPVSIDLIGFLTALEQQLRQKSPKSAALAHVIKAKQLAVDAVLLPYASASRQGVYGSLGIAIYFPESLEAFERDDWRSGYLRSNRDRRIDFVVDKDWSLFLQIYLGLPQ